MKPQIGIKKEHLEQNIKNLTVVLSNEMLLYVKIRKFHWNVSGNSFMELHQLFETHYSNLEQTIDEVAERVSELGGLAIGTMEEFLKHTTLQEHTKNFSQKEMLEELVKDHEQIIILLRKYITESEDALNDVGTADFLTGILRGHEFKSWILRKYLS